jgi:hypothetical protein
MPKSAVIELWLLGLAIDAMAFLFAHRYPLMRHANELTDIGKLAHYKGVAFAEYVGGILAITLCLLFGLRQTRRLSPLAAGAPVLTCGVVAVAFFGMMYPVNAIDIFIYASRSRLWSTYGQNPIAVKPAVFPNDAWTHFASEWGNSVSPYGPLWNWIAWPVTKISGANIDDALLGFKALACVSIVLGAVVIFAIAQTLRPGTGATAALLYLWNPLVLWEGAGNGHNDVIMLLPLLLAALLFVRRRFPMVVPLIVAAALIKYVALLLLPFAVIAIWRLDPSWSARLRNAIWSLVGSAAATAFALAPFFDLDAIRASVKSQGNIVLTSPASLAVGKLTHRYPNATIVHWAHLVGYSILGAGCLAIAIFTFFRPNRVFRSFFEVLFLYLITAAWTVRPWYGIWLVALAALLPAGWPTARALVWSLTMLSSYAMFIWGWYWWKVSYFRIQNMTVAIMFIPPVLVALFELLVWAWRRLQAARSPGAA